MAGLTWGSWQTSSVLTGAQAATAAGSTIESEALSLSGFVALQYSVELPYHASATAAVRIEERAEVASGTYQGVNDAPYGYNAPFAAGATRYAANAVAAADLAGFKVAVVNNSGQAITPTLRYRTATWA